MTELNDKPIYFQWQNEALLKTIYPLRETKLRDFLVYFYEIEIWEENYSKKEIKDIPDEVEAYKKSQKEKWDKAIEDYDSLKEYFETEDVSAIYRKNFPQLDEKYLRVINDNIHKRFNIFYSKEQSLRREKNLIIDRLRWLEKDRKDIQFELSEEQRKLRNNPNHTRKDDFIKRIDQLENVTLKIAQLEIQKLNDFLNAFSKVERSRAELDKWQKLKSKEWQEKDKSLKKRKVNESELQQEIDVLTRSIQRLREPNAEEKMSEYLTDEDVLDNYQGLFGQVNDELVASINRAHHWFVGELKRSRTLAQIISQSVLTYTKSWAYKDPVRKQMAEYEIGLMEDFVAVQGKSEEQIASVIFDKEKKRTELERHLSKLKTDSSALENDLNSISDNLSLKVNEQLKRFTDLQEVTVRDVTRNKVEDYKNLLSPKDGITMPVIANSELTVMTLDQRSGGQAPRLVPKSENGQIKKVRVGSKFRVSMIDRSPGIAEEDGIVDIGGSGKHFQVVSCPDDPSLVHTYVPADKVDEIDGEKLLELVVEKFIDDPTRYPLWLQYMVVHFSGMRYQSAHGSWADPRDLLISLTEKAVEKEITQASEEAIEFLSQEKIEIYEGVNIPDNDLDADEVKVIPPPLALTEDQVWVVKREGHIKALKSSIRRAKVPPREDIVRIPIYQISEGSAAIKINTSTIPANDEFTVGEIVTAGTESYYRIEEYEGNRGYEGNYVLDDDISLLPDPRKRKYLLDLRIDEETYEAETSDDQQVLSELEKLKEDLDLPVWMWNEIVRMTELRLKTKNENWEQPSEDELAVRNDYASREYRAMMIEWKKKNLTGWRAEHDRSSRLIVTRAVCNEVAEHIQHLRGHTPPGGLTAKPEWYLREERNEDSSTKKDRPFFVKPKSKEDFKVGASILWLRFVSREPNAWRIARPLTLKDGSGLLTQQLNYRNWDQGREMRKAPKKKPGASTEWVYSKKGSNFKRHRIVNDKEGKAKPVNQWLRWMHEATVAAVGETADGPVVLTFETALPYEDKRRSTIGVFRHTVSELKYNVASRTFVGSFVGYVPYGDIPAEELKSMLDWDKVLPDNNISEQKKENYKAEIDRYLASLLSDDGSAQKSGEGKLVQGSPVEVAISIRKNHKEWIVGYEIDRAKNQVRFPPSPVELRRGYRLYVDKENPETAKLNFREVELYRVTRCDQEPRAEGLYVETSKVIDLPESPEGQDVASQPVLSIKEVNLLTIEGNNEKSLPIFREYFFKEDGRREKVQLKPGIPFKVSTIHYVNKKRPIDRKPDRGDGIINGDSKARCYLIVECPSQSRAVGLFVSIGAVEEIDEETYKLKITQPEVKEPQELIVRASPRGDSDTIKIFKPAPDGKKFNRITDTLPAVTEFEVDPKPAFARGKTFYRIKSLSANKNLEGLFVNVKDVTPILRVVSAPKKGKTAISLFKDGLLGEKILSNGDVIPQKAEIIVDPIVEFDKGGGFYQILEYPANKKFIGCFVRFDEVVVQEAKRKIGDDSGQGKPSKALTPAKATKPLRSSLPGE